MKEYLTPNPLKSIPNMVECTNNICINGIPFLGVTEWVLPCWASAMGDLRVPLWPTCVEIGGHHFLKCSLVLLFISLVRVDFLPPVYCVMYFLLIKFSFLKNKILKTTLLKSMETQKIMKQKRISHLLPCSKIAFWISSAYCDSVEVTYKI